MRLRVNFQRGSLGAGLTDADTTITFTEAPGFPTLASGEYIPIAIESEVVHLTAYTAGDTTGTIARGKEGTAKAAHDSGVDWAHGPLAFDAAHRDEVMAVVVHGNDSTVPRPEGYAVVNWIGDAEPANRLDHDVWDAPDPDPVVASSQKAERLQESQRNVADGDAAFGALGDAGGPSVEFRTDETGNAGIMLYAQGHVNVDGNTGYMSYRIVRVSDGVEVVGPSVVRALRWSYQYYASANFGPWIEHLDPSTEYRLEAVYQSTSGSVLTCRSRRVQASDVLPSSSGPATVPVTNGLLAHYDASALALTDGDPITTWPDETDNGNDLTGGSPVYRDSQLNGLPAVDFDGVDDLLDVVWPSLQSQPNTILVVLSAPSDGDAANDADQGSSNNRHYLNRHSTTGWRIYAGGSVVSSSVHTVGPLVATEVFDGASSFLRIERTQVASGDAGSHSSSGITVMANHDGSETNSGILAEFLFYNRLLTATEIDDVETYLATKWGIT